MGHAPAKAGRGRPSCAAVIHARPQAGHAIRMAARDQASNGIHSTRAVIAARAPDPRSIPRANGPGVGWTTWWLWRGDRTRSHPELGRENPQRPWYCVSRRGRVGRRQVFQPTQTNHTTPAGWSSPVARQAHNLKVIGSNPIPATISSPCLRIRTQGLFPSRASQRRHRHSPGRASTGLSRYRSGNSRLRLSTFGMSL